MTSSYTPLGDYLTNQPSETTTVMLTLAEVEQVLGRVLPAGAWARGWWQVVQDQGRPRPWVAVGWRVAQVLMRQAPPTITFTRIASDSIASPLAAPWPPPPESTGERRRGDPPIADR